MSAELSSYRPTLTIRVLWLTDSISDPADKTKTTLGPIDQLATTLYSNFCRSTEQPLDRGMGIPVFFHSEQPPDPAILQQSQHTILVVLVDDRMVIDSKWNKGLAEFGEAVHAAGNQHRLYPVSLTPHAFNICPVITTTNFIRLHHLPASKQTAKLTMTLTHELCRLLLAPHSTSAQETQPTICSMRQRLSPTPVMLFLSHAKADGEELAETLRDYVESSSAVQTFFDANDIAPGFDFRSELEGNIEHSV